MIIKHVKQTNRYNCGSAVVAMLTGLTIEDVERRYVRDPELNGVGWDGDEICRVLFDRGILHCNGLMKAGPDWIGTRPGIEYLKDWLCMSDRNNVAVVAIGYGDTHWVIITANETHDPMFTEAVSHGNAEWHIGDEYIQVVIGPGMN